MADQSDPGDECDHKAKIKVNPEYAEQLSKEILEEHPPKPFHSKSEMRRLQHQKKDWRHYNWVGKGPSGCDTHCVSHPCGKCMAPELEADWRKSLQDKGPRTCFVRNAVFNPLSGISYCKGKLDKSGEELLKEGFWVEMIEKPKKGIFHRVLFEIAIHGEVSATKWAPANQARKALANYYGSFDAAIEALREPHDNIKEQ